MKILAMDTAGPRLNLSLYEDTALLGKVSLSGVKNHSVILLPALEHLLEDSKIKIKEIDRIVVTKGPGSYTGLRIGVTFAKTLAWTLKKELVGMSTLEVLAANLPNDGLVAPIIDARRQNVYTGLYEKINGQLVNISSDKHTDFKSYGEFLKSFNRPIMLLGETKNFKEEAKTLGLLVNGHLELDYLNPSYLALLGAKKAPEDNILDFVPEYLKLVEAEENWQKQHPGIKDENYVEKL